METQDIIQALHATAQKHKDDKVGFGETNITLMCNDLIPKLEKLSRYEEAEKSTNEYIQALLSKQEIHGSSILQISSDEYIIIKKEDAINALYPSQRQLLGQILDTINRHAKSNNEAAPEHCKSCRRWTCLDCLDANI